MPGAPAIALDGAKGVGTTGTALRRATKSWLLDDPHQVELLAPDPHVKAAPPGTLLIDEWQRGPHVWDAVRRQVDAHAAPGLFLLTGSATPRPGSGTHSGAGRILSLRMRPMAFHGRGTNMPAVSLAELIQGHQTAVAGTTTVGLPEYCEAIAQSGFPGILALPTRVRQSQLAGYIQRIVDVDLPEAGYSVRSGPTLLRWIAAYAAASSTTAVYGKILDATTAGDGSQPSKETTQNYRDHLTRMWLLDPVPGWSPRRNPLSRLQVAPKHQLADPALAAQLMGLTAHTLQSATGAHMLGPLFESLATLSVRVAAQAAQASVGHLRTRNGDREIDLIVEDYEGRIVGIEVKLAAAVSDSDVRHLLWLRDQLPDQVTDLVVLTTGTDAYRRRNGVAVVPLALFGP